MTEEPRGWSASGSGPDHYEGAALLAKDAAGVLNGALVSHWPYSLGLALQLAQVHATLAVAAAIASLDATEGPAGGSTLGRADATDWEAVTR